MNGMKKKENEKKPSNNYEIFFFVLFCSFAENLVFFKHKERSDSE